MLPSQHITVPSCRLGPLQEIVEDDISALEATGRAVHLSASPAGSPRSLAEEQSTAGAQPGPAGTAVSPAPLPGREKQTSAGSTVGGSPQLRTPRVAEVQALMQAVPGSPRSPTAREGNAERTL